jgi:hypothetical protein
LAQRTARGRDRDWDLGMMSRRYRPTWFAILVAALVLNTWSCSPNPTPEDSRRLQQLQRDFGLRYQFELAEDTYIEATNRLDTTVDSDEAIAIYRKFWFTANILRSDSNYVYLNLYNKDGDFQYQISWDRNIGRFATSNSDHY